MAIIVVGNEVIWTEKYLNTKCSFGPVYKTQTSQYFVQKQISNFVPSLLKCFKFLILSRPHKDGLNDSSRLLAILPPDGRASFDPDRQRLTPRFLDWLFSRIRTTPAYSYPDSQQDYNLDRFLVSLSSCQ